MCTLALSLGISMMGCQKSTVHPETPTLKARTLSNAESDSIIASVGNFYDYCNAISAEPTATTTLFPHSVSMEQANSLLENTFNYYFARLNPAVVEDKNDTLMLDVAPDAEGKMSISSLAQGFNSLRTSLKSFQSGLGYNVKFLLADAEIVGEGNEARIRLVGTFGEPTVTEDIFPLLGFSAGDTWSIWKKGGKKGTTQYNGLYGAPEILTAGVNHDLVAKMPLTYFTNISSFAIPNPVNTGNPLYDPSFYSAPDNPLYVYNPVFWHNTLMHWVNYGSGNNDTLASWVIDAAMAYYRRWIPEVAKAIMSGSSTKTPIKTVIISDLVPSGNSTYPVIHRFNQLIGADISKVSLPSILSL